MRLSPLRLFILFLSACGFADADPLPGSKVEPQVKEIHAPDGSLRERYLYVLDAKGHEIRQGANEEWYPGGAKKGLRNWKDGVEEGMVVYFHPNGRKSYEANYVNGKKNGYATVWHANGQKQWQTTFKSGKTNGVWREWFHDGKKKFEATYSEGLLDGRATWWHDNGRIWQERIYQEGLPVKGTVREWDRTGKQTFPPPESQLPADEMDSQGAAEEFISQPGSAGKVDAPR